jgi:16S rRNA (adenine1518-N6/adenine1519-N6)-dimethyltransferase
MPHVEIVEADILNLDLTSLFPAGGEVAVGNIPYYLTGALLPRLIDRPPRPKRVALLVQAEVAERWTAPSIAGVATAAVQCFTEARLALRVPPEAFEPPPRVHSALVVMEVRPRPAVDLPDLGDFFGFVERAFRFRRKQLGSSLRRVTGLAAGETGERLRDAGVDPTRRAQSLRLDEWVAVYRALTG